MTDIEQNNSHNDMTEKSYLIADVGTTNTTVTLFDVALGSYRLLACATAPTTMAEPWLDISQGIRQAVQQISAVTGRRLFNKRGDIIRPMRQDGTGVDLFTAVFSAPSLLRTMIVGLSEDVSLHAAQLVLAANYTDVVGQFDPSDNRHKGKQLQVFLEANPDLVLIAGGVDGGASTRLLELLDIVRLGMKLMEEATKPTIIFAGNKALREQLTTIFGSETAVHIADNIHPTLTQQNLDNAIALVSEQYQSQKIRPLPGMREVIDWSQLPFQPTAHAFAAIIQYFAALHRGNVLGIDLGSSKVALVSVVNDKTSITVRSDLGMGHTAVNCLTVVSPADINRWLPDPISEDEIINWVQNKVLYPQTIPTSEKAVSLEYAIAREMIRQAADQPLSLEANVPAFRLLVAHGATLTNAPSIGHAVLTLLDALEPTGIFSVLIDKQGVLPALGTIAPHDPLVVVQSLENGALLNAGWVIAPVGKTTLGQKAVTVTIELPDERPLQVNVEYGGIERIPLAPGKSAKVTIKPERRFDIGFGYGKKKTVTLFGGMLGIVIDARGRPINLKRKKTTVHQLVQQWLQVLGD